MELDPNIYRKKHSKVNMSELTDKLNEVTTLRKELNRLIKEFNKIKKELKELKENPKIESTPEDKDFLAQWRV